MKEKNMNTNYEIFDEIFMMIEYFQVISIYIYYTYRDIYCSQSDDVVGM